MLMADARVVILREYPPNIDISMTRKKGDAAIIDERGQYTQARIRTNNQGFIQPCGQHENPHHSIAFLGGSTTECLWMPEESRFPSAVGPLVEEQTQLKINTYNGAFPGNDIRHSINILWNKTLQLSPSHVLLMHNINDLSVLRTSGTYWKNEERPHWTSTDKVDETVPYANLEKTFGGWFPNVKALIRKAFSSTRDDEWHGVRNAKLEPNTSQILEEYEQALKSFITICQSWNITPVLMTQANLITGIDSGTIKLNADFEASLRKSGRSYKEYQALYTQMNQVNRKLANIHSIPLIDLDREIPRKEAFFYDRVHFTEEGSKRAAEIISKSLIFLLTNKPETSEETIPKTELTQ